MITMEDVYQKIPREELIQKMAEEYVMTWTDTLSARDPWIWNYLASFLVDYLEYQDDLEGLDLDDMITECADACTEFYYSKQYEWLCSSMDRVDLLDEVVSEVWQGRDPDIWKAIGWAQYEEIERVLYVARDIIMKILEELGDAGE